MSKCLVNLGARCCIIACFVCVDLAFAGRHPSKPEYDTGQLVEGRQGLIGRPAADVCDDFDGETINTALWSQVSGSWSQSDGIMTGDWSLGSAHTDQGNLLLQDAFQPTGDYTFDVDLYVQAGDANRWRIVLYHSSGNKYNIVYELAGYVGCEVRIAGADYRPALWAYEGLGSYFNTEVGEINHARVVKAGNAFTAYLNGHELFTLVDIIWDGDVKVGVGAYGLVAYDRVCVGESTPGAHNQRVLLYTTRGSGTGAGSRGFHYNENLPVSLEAEGFSFTLLDRQLIPALSTPLLQYYDQLWLVSTETSASFFDAPELQAIQEFFDEGKSILLIGDDCSYDGPANQIATELGLSLSFSGAPCEADHCGGSVGCAIATSEFAPHELWQNVTTIQGNLNEGSLQGGAPGQIVANHSGFNMIGLQELNGRRVAWDATWYRFTDSTAHPDLGINHEDNLQYAKNLAGWLANQMNDTSWSFANSEANMWPSAWWQAFNYCYAGSPCDLYCLLCRPSDFPNWDLFVEAVSPAAAYFDPPPGQVSYRPSALAQWEALRGVWTGSCFGFAASRSLFYDGFLKVDSVFSGYSSLNKVPLSAQSRSLINKYYLYQFGYQQQQRINSAVNSITPAATLAACQAMLAQWPRNDRALMMFHQTNTGGHAVAPYRCLEDGSDPDLWYIYAYDSNFPEDTTKRVEINTASNTWSYSGQPGWGGSYGLFLLDSVSNYLDPLVLADTNTATEQIRFYFGEADSAHFTSGGGTLGFDQNGTYGSVTGGSPIIPVDGNETPPIGYFLPTGEWYCRASGVVDGVFTVVDGHKRVFRNGGAKSGIISCYYRADAVAPSLTSYGGGGKPGRGIYDSSFIEVINITPDSEVVVQISGLEIPAGDSVTLTLTADQQVQFDNFGTAAEYDLLIQIVSTTVDTTFYHEAVEIGTSTSHLITPDWRIHGDSVVIGIDTSMTGNFGDSTITVPNSELVPFVCGDADGNGMISISDAVFLINYIFGGGPAPNPVIRGDADCNGLVTISDAVYLINYIFAGGPMPCAACE